MLPTQIMEKPEERKTISFRDKTKSLFMHYEISSLAIFFILMFIFSFFMFLPILSISVSAFNFTNPSNFFQHFIYCFESTNYRQSILNTIFVGLTTTLICSIIGLTVTIIFSRYHFFGKRFFQILTILPLVAPPFVGAFALRRLLDNNGIVTNFFQLYVPGLTNLLGASIWGIVLMQSIHLWPLIFFNTAASYSKIDPAQEEQARNLGSWSLSLYRQIILPLITPGFVAGAVLVFIWSISDLGTPIVLFYRDYAPFLAFKELRKERGAYVEGAYALVIILLIVSLLALLFASKIVGMRDYAPEKVSGMEQTRLMQKASKPKTFLILLILIFLLLISLLPHIGIFTVAFVERIKIGEVIPTLWTLDGVSTALGKADIVAMIFNSLIYSALAMGITVLIGIIVGYLIVRKKNLKGITFIMTVIGGYVGLILGAQIATGLRTIFEKQLAIFSFCFVMAVIFFAAGRTMNLRTLEIFSTMPFAVPGIVLAAGYIRFFSSTTSLWGFLPAEIDLIPIVGIVTSVIRQSLLSIPNNPLEFRFTSFWFILVVSYSMRRMPYAVQSSTAVLRQIHESLEEVAHNLGASASLILRRVTIPLMASGVLAGGILTFITSFTEVSTSIMITPINQPFRPFYSFSPLSDPITKGIYDEINRGGDVAPAGVMGLVQLLVAGIGMVITQKLLGEKTGTAFGG
ncbi:MAG: ABC transporter permease [Candidatus Hodarchaeota archaeon]